MANHTFRFCHFKDPEFDMIARLLSGLFNVNESMIAAHYQSLMEDFETEGYPDHLVSRTFFTSKDPAFQKIYLEAPSVGVDIPSVIELDDGVENKPTIAIIGQDPKRSKDSKEIDIGTPYGMHHKGSRDENNRLTGLYAKMIAVPLKMGYRIYLTDVYKIWVYGTKAPPKADLNRFKAVLRTEIGAINPDAVITLGCTARDEVAKLNINNHLWFYHPKNWGQQGWAKDMGRPFTEASALDHWTDRLKRELPSRKKSII